MLRDVVGNFLETLTEREFDWGWDNYVSLAPWADVAHVLTVVED